MGYFILFSLGDHIPMCVLPLLLDCCFLGFVSLSAVGGMFGSTICSSYLNIYRYHLNTTVLVPKSSMYQYTGLSSWFSTCSSCPLLSKSEVSDGMGIVLVAHWRERMKS